MIQQALNLLPDNKGTKSEIFDKINEVYGIQLSSPENGVLCKTLTQFLSKYFGKTASKEYALNMQDKDFESFQSSYDSPLLSMKTMIVASLLALPQCRGSTRDIKAKLLELFRPALEGVEWESTLIKSLSRYKGLFVKSDAVYQIAQEEV